MMEEYKDVFPKELPQGLPPKRSVEISIDLEKDAKPKMGPMYKLSRKELEQIRKQIEEAPSLGFIRPSISFGEVQCYLHLKKKEVSECV